jgi:acetyl-CoA carboxylase biotin carboxyl carrier protein
MALKINEIHELIRIIDESNVDEFELERDGEKVVIRKAKPEVIHSPIQTSAAPAVVASAPVVQAAQPSVVTAPVEQTVEEASSDSQLHKIVSPMVGTFYCAPSPDAEPYVKEGDVVNKKTVVCIVEAMKLMNELEAEVDGKIVKVLVENGQLVEYGQPLFLVDPS